MFVFFGPSLLLPPSLSSLNPSPLLEGGHGALQAQPLCWGCVSSSPFWALQQPLLCLLQSSLCPSTTSQSQPSRLQPSASSFCKTLSHQSQGTFASLADPHRALREASREALSAELSLLHLLGPAEWRSCQQLWTGTCYFLALCLHLKIGRVPHVWWVWRKAECFYENLRAARLHPVNTADRPEPRR